MIPGGVGSDGEYFVHGGGLLFACASAYFGTDDIRGKVPGCSMQPAGEHWMVAELRGILGECGKDGLRHVLGEVRIAHQPLRCGVHKVHVAADEFGEGGFGSFSCKIG